MRDSAYNNN